jgi:hypothetical protein
VTGPRSVPPPSCRGARDQVPGCETGPLGRLDWAIREIAGLLRHARHDSDNEVDDAR